MADNERTVRANTSSDLVSRIEFETRAKTWDRRLSWGFTVAAGLNLFAFVVSQGDIRAGIAAGASWLLASGAIVRESYHHEQRLSLFYYALRMSRRTQQLDK